MFILCLEVRRSSSSCDAERCGAGCHYWCRPRLTKESPCTHACIHAHPLAQTHAPPRARACARAHRHSLTYFLPHSLSGPIARQRYLLREIRTPQNGARLPLVLSFTLAHLCDTPFATYHAMIVQYPEFCDTIVTSIAEYDKYRYWASKRARARAHSTLCGLQRLTLREFEKDDLEVKTELDSVHKILENHGVCCGFLYVVLFFLIFCR